MNIDTKKLMYPSIDISNTLATMADIRTAVVEITSDILSYEFPFIAAESIVFAIFL